MSRTMQPAAELAWGDARPRHSSRVAALAHGTHGIGAGTGCGGHGREARALFLMRIGEGIEKKTNRMYITIGWWVFLGKTWKPQHVKAGVTVL